LLTSIVFFFSWWRWPLPLVALHRHGCWAKWAVNLHWRHWMNNVHLLYASACSSLVIGSGLVHFAVCVFFFFLKELERPQPLQKFIEDQTDSTEQKGDTICVLWNVC
jgi:hypothetical protein